MVGRPSKIKRRSPNLSKSKRAHPSPPSKVTSFDPTSLSRPREEVAARVSALLERARSHATLDDVKALIFFESPERHASEYFADIIALFPTGIDIDTLLPIIRDAWNHFPHLSLDGRCPAEVMLQNLAGVTPRRRPSSH